MTKLEFLEELKKELCGLPSEDVQKSLEFYSELIDDKIEDGLSEEDAVSQIGNIEEIAKQILSDIPITKLVKQKIKPKPQLHIPICRTVSQSSTGSLALPPGELSRRD